ncbi:type VII secretion target [Streptoalloteichus hindustanus]|uniref:Excreted virulence factor EspC, type VII ESX diderm n=1 Tax=Streptoalloteichus hindustanus TaxID=2017 RepID=A0A1M5GWJ4_STRHI|nr:type VII secretion target [Streptoalloteichus hindustanus]SHG08080.1 Excreted virulence factor EspC, type VII ESX diderm [Streptoalloteichus hindustanus]
MSEHFRVVPDELRGYSELLKRNSEHFLAIRDYAEEKGGDTSGFTGVLSLLHPAVTGVANLYGMTLEFANERLTKVAASLEAAAGGYERADRTGQQRADEIHTMLESARAVPGGNA